MKKILLIYKTNTGFTKIYANWISENISCEQVPIEMINDVDINSFDIIIFGGGLHASRIRGFKTFKKKVMGLNKEIIVFVTGGSPCEDKIVENIKKDNFKEKEFKSIKFFYFQSGINYEKMGFTDKTILKIYNSILKFKNKKSDIEIGTSRAILNSYDKSNIKYIEPMVKYLKGIIN